MKSTHVIIYFLAFSLLFSSCNQDTTSSENEKLSLSPEQIKIKETWNSSSDWVKQITLSDTLVIRNTQWGVAIDEIKEKIKLSDSQPPHGKSYSLYFDDSDLNFVDIVYIPNKAGKLDEIDLDIFVEEIPKVGQLRESISNYFDAKFGPSETKGNKTQWNQNKNTQVELEDMSTSKDPGIRVILKSKI
jgi:hypothetical protein